MSLSSIKSSFPMVPLFVAAFTKSLNVTAYVSGFAANKDKLNLTNISYWVSMLYFVLISLTYIVKCLGLI
jgi:hypothetical protein